MFAETQCAGSSRFIRAALPAADEEIANCKLKNAECQLGYVASYAAPASVPIRDPQSEIRNRLAKSY